MSTSDNCGICGGPGHQCTGVVTAPVNSRLIITSAGAAKVAGPLRAPRQRPTIGKPGYIGERDGRVVTFDPKHPSLPLVQHLTVEDDDDSPSEAADEAQQTDAPNEAGEGGEATQATPDADSGAVAAAGAKERKPKPADKSRKDGAGSK